MAPTDSPAAVCPRCRLPLLVDAPEGLCARCLARQVFGAEVSVPAGLPPSLEHLRHFGDYELIHEIARGGMGVVYRARQRSLNREVALKLLRDGALATNAENDRFREEAAAAAALRHPNIVAVHEIGEHEGQQFFSMDLVEGQNLAELTREGPLPVRRAVEQVAVISDAIQHAHDRGVLHRDLKPSNVIVDAAGVPHVTDFGLARRVDSDSQLTLTGEILGTPGYMAPEQAAGRSREVTAASDTYSLGAILYHLLTARAPFVGETPTAVLRQVEEQEPVAPRLLNPAVPVDLETIAIKALNKDPGRRYATAAELAADLRRWLRGEPIHARPVSRGEHIWRWCRRNPALAASGLVSLLLVLAVIGVISAASWRLAAQRQEAEQVTRFLQDILAAPNPDQDGREVRVIDILKRARQRAAVELAHQPLVRAEIETTLGVTYYQLSLYDDAEPLLRSALEIYERDLGPDAGKTAQAHGHLGSLLGWSGRSTAGIEELQLAIRGARRHQPKQRELLAGLLGELGSAYIAAGRLRDAEPPLRECLALCAQAGSALTSIRAAALGDLSTAVADQGGTEWRDLLEQAIALNRKLPDGKVNLATTLSNLADGLVEEGALDRAESAAREALALRLELFGTNSTPAAFAHARLGTVLVAQTNFSAALAEAALALAIQEAQLPADHRDLQFTLRLQGRALLALGRAAEAETTLRRARDISLKAYGTDHRSTHGVACLLAEALLVQGRRAEAEPLFAAALPVLRRAIEAEPPDSLQRRRLEHFEQLYETTRQPR